MRNRDSYGIKYTVILLILLGGTLRLLLSSKMQMVNVDSIGSFQGDITIYEYLTTLPGYWSPLYPLLCITANYVFNDIELSGKVVSIIMGTGLVYVIFVLARKLYGDTVALISAVMVAFNPVLIYYSLFMTPEMTYLFFLYLSILHFVKWAELPTTLVAVLMGAFVAATYLTRSEGFLLAFQIGLMGLLVIIYEAWRNRIAFAHSLISLAAFLIAFSILVLPYLTFLKHEIGHWTISRIGGANLEITMDKVESQVYSLTDDRKRVLGYHHDGYRKVTLTQMIRNDPHKIAEKWNRNSRYLLTFILPKLFLNKYILIVFTMMIIIVLMWKRKDMKKHMMLLFLLSPMIITPFYVIELRTQIYIIPVILILSSVTLGSFADILFIRIRIKRLFTSTFGMILFSFFLISSTIVYYRILEPRVAEKGSYGIELKKAGLWLGESDFPPGAVVSRKPWVAVYSGNRPLPLPLASYEDILYYARENNARYFVIDDLLTVQRRPVLSFLLKEIPIDLELIYDNNGKPDHRVRIFRIKEMRSDFNVAGKNNSI